MKNDMIARQLHDKATQGGALTDAERARLEAWYAQQDEGENALLVSSAPSATTILALRSEVETASARLLTGTQHIQMLIDENEALRQEIAKLGRQLAQPASLQTA